MSRLLQPVLAGLVTAVVGFASSFAVVLAGLRAVGADERQAASGLLALCVTMGLVAVGLGVRRRMPISIAWSTPGAALLVSTGAVDGGFPVAVGAFVVCGLLITAAGLVPALGRWIAAIPAPVASAMLAGVLFDLCVAPVRALVEVPVLAAPIVLTWAVLNRLARRWAVPAALAVAVLAIALTTPDGGLRPADLWPAVAFTAPAWSLPAMVSIALPLFLVTMASQNVPGMAVLAGYGYRPPLRGILASTGVATVAGAPFGGHAVNLAAITAALAASPDAHPDPERRWVASVTAGAGYVVLGLGSGVATAFVLLSPPVLVEAVAGLALLGALAAAVTAAVAEPAGREGAVVTFVVTASGVTVLGVGAAFWGLLAGGFILLLQRKRHGRPGRRPSGRHDRKQAWQDRDQVPSLPEEVVEVGDGSYDVVVVGGGAAGLTAALVLSRARRRVLVVDAGTPRNAPAAHMHGFLSRDGLPPAELLRVGREEIRQYGGEIVDDRVQAVEPGFTLRLSTGRAVRARRLLVATGLTDELPDVPGLRERWGRDVLHCPYCHGWEVRDEPLGVLASGPISVHQALLVRQWSPDVLFFAHDTELGAEDRARLGARGVAVVDGPVARMVVDGDHLTGVRLADGTVHARSAVFVAPRLVANDAVLAGLGVRTVDGPLGTWVEVDATGRTSVPGVWAAGNVADPTAQVISAAGAGSRAAIALNADLVEADVADALAASSAGDAPVPA